MFRMLGFDTLTVLAGAGGPPPLPLRRTHCHVLIPNLLLIIQARLRAGLGCVCFQIINLNKEVKELLSSNLGGFHTSPIQKLSYSEDKSSAKSFLQSGRWYLASGECLCWLNSSLSPSHPTWRKVLSCVLWYVVSLDQTKMSIRFPKIFLLLHNVSETDQYKIRSLSAPEKASSLSKSIMSQG